MKSIMLSFALFLLAFIAVRHVWPEGIMFYQGVALSVLSGGLHFAQVRLRGVSLPGTALKDAALVFLLAYSFMFTLPTTVDRSYSVKLIAELGRSPDGLRREQMESLFADDFFKRGAVARRIDEQAKSGTIELQGANYRLTRRGQLLNELFLLSCEIFACHQPQ